MFSGRIVLFLFLLCTGINAHAQYRPYDHRSPFRPCLILEGGANLYRVSNASYGFSRTHVGWTLNLTYYQPVVPVGSGSSFGVFGTGGVSESWYTIFESREIHDYSAWGMIRLPFGVAFRVNNGFYPSHKNSWDGWLFGTGLSYNMYSFGDKEHLPDIAMSKPRGMFFAGYHSSDCSGNVYLTQAQHISNADGSVTFTGWEFGFTLGINIL